MEDDVVKLGAALAVLAEYGREHECSVWLERTRYGAWHARVCHYEVYDGGSEHADPLQAALTALAYATLAAADARRGPAKGTLPAVV